jgi:hypothetical protein
LPPGLIDAIDPSHADLITGVTDLDDLAEGLATFKEKRSPGFTGR